MPKRKFTGRRGGLTKKQKRQVRRIAYRMGGEQKFQLHEIAATSIDSSTGLNKFLPAIAQGTDQGERIGDEIHLDRLVIEGAITFSDTTNVVRVVVASQPAAGIYTMLPFYTSTYKAVDTAANGIKVWRDFLMTGGAGGPVSKKFKLNIPFKKRGQPGMKVQYNSTGSQDLIEGAPHLCLFFISDSGTAGHPTVQYHGRLFYHDN